MILCIVLPTFWLPDIAQRTTCTKNVPRNPTFHFSASSFLCNIGGPRYKQNNTGHNVSRIGYYSTIDYLDNLIPYFVLPISQLPDVTQKTTCTENVAMDVTFHLRYTPASINV